jgi:tetratricopeptide (TPR) repeat protein
VHAGTGQLVLVTGESGVGKTRLAQEVLQVAQAQGFGGITGRCYAPQATVPYYPFLEALSRAYNDAPLAVRTALPLQWPDLTRLIPNLSPGTTASPGPHPDGGGVEEQQRLFWQVTGFLQALTEERPFALVLDDLHWIDTASLELLLHLARQTRDRPILLLGTYRESEVARDHALSVGVIDLIQAHLIEQLELKQLSREATAALLSVMVEEGEISEAVTDLIYGSAEGNAFFVHELLRTLLERGDIVQGSSGCWELHEGAAVTVPNSVQAAILERVARLSVSAQKTLGVASVLGQRFRFGDLLATTSRMTQTAGALAAGPGEAESRLEAVLEEAVRARLLREVGASGYDFSHALAQQALYEQLSARRRRRLHRAAAESMDCFSERERAERASDIAYHFLQAEELARALPYLLQAGEQALLLGAYSEAERRFRTALDQARRIGDDEAKSRALEQLGWVLYGSLRHEEAVPMMEQAIAEAERRGDHAQMIRLARPLINLTGNQGIATEEIVRILHVIEVTQAAGLDLALLYVDLAYLHCNGGQYAEQLATVEHAMQIAQAEGDAGVEATVRTWRGLALLLLGRLEEARAELEAAVPVLENARNYYELIIDHFTLAHLGIVLQHLGRMDDAQTRFERSLSVADPIPPDGEAMSCAFCARTAFLRGDWSTAHRYVERGVVQRPYLQSNSFADAYLYGTEGHLKLAEGDLEAAAQCAEACLALPEWHGTLQWKWYAHHVLAQLDLLRGDPSALRDRLLPLLERTDLVQTGRNAFLPLLVWAHLELGDVNAAEVLATQTVTDLREQHDHLSLVDALRMEAAVHIRQLRWDEAEAALEEALALAREMPYPYAEAKALSTYGDLLVVGGQPERAHDRYEAAMTILRSLGEVPYTLQIERALAELSQH